ncbi:ribosome maturation factor RimM [Citroniella saccharovorans]|uniref:Ribosome maturation factor RimM n=1 Tax=Citroniella saccharovorans TaxID=2053367 RepID=A0AAW9MV00_9FIRM|nr:ribosome maturation factor RimM [Citroniella saccharovorans]MEB3429648.1 ribosome maturation factor RimM [Citroniella saccharovorans]
MDLIKVGEIVASHGIKGEVKLFPLTENIERFNKDQFFYIDNQSKKVSIERFKTSGNLLIIKFNEFNNLNDVSPFIKKSLYTSSEDLIELKNDEYFIFDLVGLNVFEGNNFLGYVTDIIENETNDILVVKTEKKEILIPFIKVFIKKVDLYNKKILVSLIDGIINDI